MRYLANTSAFQLFPNSVIYLASRAPTVRMLLFILIWIDFSQFQAYLRKNITYQQIIGVMLNLCIFMLQNVIVRK